MKKKVNMWIQTEVLSPKNKIPSALVFFGEPKIGGFTKLDVVYELPEKKIEVTERQVREAYYSKLCLEHGVHGLINKLFGE